MIDAASLVAMRAAQASALPDVCTRTRTPLEPDGIGGQKAGTAVTTTLYCRLSSRGIPDQYRAMDAVQGKQLWMATFTYGADVQARDVLVIDGKTMTVLGLASGGDWETAVRAVCVEVT